MEVTYFIPTWAGGMCHTSDTSCMCQCDTSWLALPVYMYKRRLWHPTLTKIPMAMWLVKSYCHAIAVASEIAELRAVLADYQGVMCFSCMAVSILLVQTFANWGRIVITNSTCLKPNLWDMHEDNAERFPRRVEKYVFLHVSMFFLHLSNRLRQYEWHHISACMGNNFLSWPGI